MEGKGVGRGIAWGKIDTYQNALTVSCVGGRGEGGMTWGGIGINSNIDKYQNVLTVRRGV